MAELKKILLDKAKFHLEDDAYKTIESFVNMEAWLNLRIFLGDLAEEAEIKSMIIEDRTDEWLAIDEMNDIAIEFAIEKNDDEDDGIVKSRRKRISPRSETIL